MHFDSDRRLVFSATDLSHFLACRRKTALDHAALRGDIEKPEVDDPVLEVLRLRGQEHEKRFVDRERAAGHDIVDLTSRDADDRPRPGLETREKQIAATLDAMSRGVPRIVQAALASSDGRWFGYADVLRRVEKPSRLGAWSYEALDTKLARETKGATVLQLCLYSDMLAEIQGLAPEHFYVVTPIAEERYRLSDYAAYYRLVKRNLVTNGETLGPNTPAPDPEPVAHCAICDWRDPCEQHLRDVDHLSFVAGCSRLQREELAAQGMTNLTLEILGRDGLPRGFKPSRGARATYDKLQHQARLQLEARQTRTPAFECLPIEPKLGLCKLPAPSPGDVFLDLEGAAWAREGGREYLFGLVTIDATGEPVYSAYQAFDDAQEREAFEAAIDRLIAALDAHPDMHVYHFAPYEPSAFKRLMGRYATRGAELDRLLRAERFVDLYGVIRHAIRAGIESYSIKELEQFYEFRREADLHAAGRSRRLVEHALDMSTPDLITDADFDIVRAYNRDDCVSALRLRDWLEKLRAEAIQRGETIERPPLDPGDPPDKQNERDKVVAELRGQLLAGVPGEAANRSPEQQARHLLGYLLDFHRREDKAGWWNYFRLRDLPEEALLDEREAVSGLEFVGEVGNQKKSFIHRYQYPPQEIEIRRDHELKRQDGKVFATVVAHDRTARTLDLLVGPSKRRERPAALFAHKRISPEVMEDALVALGRRVLDVSGVEHLPAGSLPTLLLREPPSLTGEPFSAPPRVNDDIAATSNYAVSIVTRLNSNGTTLAVQGPPGSGKTHTGARMILAATRAGLRVGVTATSHKVIRNLLDAVVEQHKEDAKDSGSTHPLPAIGHKANERDNDEDAAAFSNVSAIRILASNEEASAAWAHREVQVMGGTAWLWARPEFANAVDVLFVDEAGQMSLANVLAVAQATSSLVLLGDPQQLDQPSKGTHPDGVDVSALAHVIGDAQTMPEGRGLLLPITWRLAPPICRFTSEAFYAGELAPRPDLKHQRLVGAAPFDGSGLWIVPVQHSRNRSSSDEEVDVVAQLVASLTAPGAEWIDRHERAHPLTLDDVLVVAPYNAQVARLTERLNLTLGGGARVGTVDKFQGQEAPVVIYSMASSRPEDAPRGMEFLYSLNRLNVATSRAQCAVIVVASPALFEPECSTPRQMQLANGLGRYVEHFHASGR